MRVLLSFLPFALVCVLPGCAASGTEMIEEAEPFARAAAENVDSLVVYLEASGVDINLVESSVGPLARTQAIRATFVEFTRGGACEVLTYESPDDAEQFGPRSGGGALYTRRAQTFMSGDFVETRARYKPTYRFGPLVAACFNEDPLVFRALRSLEDFAHPDS